MRLLAVRQNDCVPGAEEPETTCWDQACRPVQPWYRREFKGEVLRDGLIAAVAALALVAGAYWLGAKSAG